MPATKRRATIYATRRKPAGPRESRHEQVTAHGIVLYEDDWRVDFQADDGEVRVFMRDAWDVHLIVR